MQVIDIKDLFCYKKHDFQSNNKIAEEFKSQFTITAIQQLINQDTIIINRQGYDKFVMDSSNEHLVFDAAKNT